MKRTVVLCDTNVLPSHGSTESTFWRALARICAARGVELAITEIAREEAVNRRREAAVEAVEALRKGHAAVSRLVDVEPLYLPDVDAMVDSFTQALDARFQTIELHGDDAREALRREASRIPPARKGVGGRDSAIWLSALRLAASGHDVLFVTRNSRDFGEGTLLPELQRELDPLSGSLTYVDALGAVLDHVARNVATPSLDWRIVNGLAASQLLSEALLYAVLGGESSSADDVQPMTLLDIQPLSAYEVEGKGLLNFTARTEIVMSDLVASSGLEGWVTFDLERNTPISVDLSGFQWEAADTDQER